MALETELKTKIPHLTHVQSHPLTIWLWLALWLLFLLLLHEVDKLVHGSHILLEELHKFVIIALQLLLCNSDQLTLATTRLSVIHCLDLQGATDRLSEFIFLDPLKHR